MPDPLRCRPSSGLPIPSPALAFFLAGCLACPDAGASEVDYAPLRSVTQTDGPVGGIPETTVAVETAGQGQHLRIGHLKVSNKDWAVDVPQGALVDLADPLLDTVRLITEAGRDNTPWLYVTFRLGNPKPGEPWDSPTVYLTIRGGRLGGRRRWSPSLRSPPCSGRAAGAARAEIAGMTCGPPPAGARSVVRRPIGQRRRRDPQGSCVFGGLVRGAVPRLRRTMGARIPAAAAGRRLG
jgi:hypothetical protein